MKPSAILEAIMLAIITFNSLCRDRLLLIRVSRLFILAPTHMKTLTNQDIIIVDNTTVVMLDVTRLQ